MALTQVNSSGIKDLEVKTDDIANEAVTFAKIENIDDGQILVGNGSNRPAERSLSGDVTMSNTGAVTIASGAVEHAMLADDCVDGDNIADNSVGLAAMAGGTDGNLITYDTSGDPAHVVTGSSGQVLTSNGAGAAPTFQTISAGGDLSFGGDTFGADKVIGSNDNYALSVETNGTERFKVTNAGVIELASGTGIKFHGIPSSNTEANTLWDYEIGSFTATLGNSVTIHSDQNTLRYIKIGHMVHISGELRVNDPNGNGTKHLYINNLPFNNNNTFGERSFFSSGFSRHNKTASGSNTCGGNYYVEINQNQVWFYANRTDNTDDWFPALYARQDGYIGLDITYFTVS